MQREGNGGRATCRAGFPALLGEHAQVEGGAGAVAIGHAVRIATEQRRLIRIQHSREQVPQPHALPSAPVTGSRLLRSAPSVLLDVR